MKKIALASLALLAAPLAAQSQNPNQDLGEKLPQDGRGGADRGRRGPVRNRSAIEGNLEDLGIAIPSFATDRDAATPASTAGTAALGNEMARIVFNDLRNNGLFKPTGPDALAETGLSRDHQPQLPDLEQPRHRHAGAGLCPRAGGRASWRWGATSTIQSSTPSSLGRDGW